MTQDGGRDVELFRSTPMEIVTKLVDLPEETRHMFLTAMMDWAAARRMDADRSLTEARAAQARADAQRIDAEARRIQARGTWWMQVSAAFVAYALCAVTVGVVALIVVIVLTSLNVIETTQRVLLLTPTLAALIGVMLGIVRGRTRR